MAIRSLCNICRRQISGTSSLRIFYKGTRRKIDEQRKDLVETLEKTSKEVFAIAETNAVELDRKKGRETIEDAIFIYLQRQGKTRRGHVEFILSALEKLKDYKVNRDLSIYKSLFSIFPEKKMVAKNLWQSEFMHFPKQQDCAIDILIAMEDNGVIPDDEMGRMILSRFGMESMVMARYQRMMYWMPKVRHINPWPVPYWLPTDQRKLSKLALTRLSSDRLTEVTVHETKLIPGVEVDTYITSCQSPDQRQLLAKHDKTKPLYVEGPITSWFREKQLTHYILRADPDEKVLTQWREHQAYLQKTKFSFTPDTFKWYNFIEGEEILQIRSPTIHEQDDGIVMGMAIVGDDSIECLRAWLQVLTIDNPTLQDIGVVFKVNFPSDASESLDSESDDVKQLPARQPLIDKTSV